MIWPNDFINKIICGDCLEIMKEMPDKSVNLVLTDPPYGIDICNRKQINYGLVSHLSRNPSGLKWDKRRLTKSQWKEIKRVSKNQIIFGANYFWDYFYPTNCYLIWDKRGELPDVPFMDTELIWTSFVKRGSKKYIVRHHGFIKDDKEFKENHPTQKPLILIINMLLDFSQENDIILDPFLGSGTTTEACKLSHRKFIGIEINPEYCKIANKRLAQGVL